MQEVQKDKLSHDCYLRCTQKCKGLTAACWGVMRKGGMSREGGKLREVVAGWQNEAAEEPARPVGLEEFGL